jgi:uncharacterized DUF497 family protein
LSECVDEKKESQIILANVTGLSMIDFEWDPSKARTNLRKHGVSFREAATVFRDSLSITAYDPDHSEEEGRYITVGTSVSQRFLIVAHTDRGTRIRVISARELTRAERKAYENEIQKRKG